MIIYLFLVSCLRILCFFSVCSFIEPKRTNSFSCIFSTDTTGNSDLSKTVYSPKTAFPCQCSQLPSRLGMGERTSDYLVFHSVSSPSMVSVPGREGAVVARPTSSRGSTSASGLGCCHLHPTRGTSEVRWSLAVLTLLQTNPQAERASTPALLPL